ncbi:SDR family NAD(P)-dependent oxidoreductase [Oxyplasma meridianum]|uniref:SDR family NAD(P)-dependent oxidoreductase n=1 Tax=Oxyplasma meridianum TaxID=3073602 RepID=A0AAX4NER3_9ARCH
MVDLIRDSLAGKVAVIIGVGPGQGISTVRMFINFGAKVAVVSRSGNTFGLVESSTIKAYKADATNAEELQKLRDKIIADYGSVDVVCNNVGVWRQPKGEFEDPAQMEEMFRINVMSMYNSIRIFSEAMKKKGGSIVNIGASRNLFKGNSIAYTVSKSAIEELTRKTAETLRKYNIRVNAVLPGGVNKDDNYYKVFPFNYTKISETFQLEPIEIAMVTSFLGSEMSTGINGQSITVDRGMSA